MVASASALPPIPRTRLIGRAAERAAARTRLLDEAVPLLTLTGPGGVGKTRLALAIAEDLATSFADGLVFVDLAPIRDPAQAWIALAQTLGLRDREGRTPLRLVTSYLKRRQMLLVLDNCEHLLALAPDIGELLATCPAVHVLATSRAPLRIRGEHLLAVQPLELPAVDGPIDVDALSRVESVDLFVQRGGAVSSGFGLTAENAAEVAEICRRLDGLPLALELAAARLRHLSPDALLALLTHRLRLLTGGERDAPARQQTLRDAIAWSYNLLAPEEQRVFRRFAVFVGGFDLEAALAVASDSAEADTGVEIVGSLVDQSLIQRDVLPDGRVRFRMLETVREFAADRLDLSGETEQVRRAHAGFFLRLTEQAEGGMYSSDPGRWLDRLEIDYPNCRAALEAFAAAGDVSSESWMASLVAEFWQNRGRLAEGIACLEDVLARGTHAAPIPRAKAMIDLSLLLREVGDCDRALELTAEAERIARTASDRGHRMGQVLYVRAWNIGSCREGWADVVPLLEETLELMAGVAPDAPLATAALADLGWARARLGDVQRGRRLLDDAVKRAGARTQRYALHRSLTMAGLLDHEAGNIAAAADRYRQALEQSEENRLMLLTIYPLAGLVGLAMERGWPEPTARLWGMIDAVWEQTGAGSRTPRLEKWQRIADAASLRARALLGDEAFSAGVEAGRGLPFAAAISEALAIAHAIAAGTPVQAFAAAVPVGSPAGPPPLHEVAPLSRREREVLNLLAQRWTAPEIAHHLFLSPRTVEGYVASLYNKLGVSTRRDACSVALRHGLLEH